MAKQSFPGPYINGDLTEDDPMMIRRPGSHMDIGARKSTLSQTHEKSGLMNIKHTGDDNALTRRGK
jgi:hypothetical protein